MPQYLVAIHHPDGYDGSLEDEATHRDMTRSCRRANATPCLMSVLPMTTSYGKTGTGRAAKLFSPPTRQ